MLGCGGANSGAASDPHFANVAFLCSFDGADAATSATDDSSDARTITFNGTAQLDTAQFKFGTASLLTDGSDGSFVSIPDHADWAMAGEFTIEAWIRFATTPDSAGEHIIGQRGDNGAFSWSLYIADSGVAETAHFRFSTDGSTETHAVGSTDLNFSVDTWYHLCAERDSSNKIRLYWDGVMVGSKTSATGTAFNSAVTLRLGQNSRTATDKEMFSGWIDEPRITIGTARYASDSGFTVPSAAYPRS